MTKSKVGAVALALAIVALGFSMSLPKAHAAVVFNTLNGVTFNDKASLTGLDAVNAGANIHVVTEIIDTSDDDVNTICADWVGDALPRTCEGFTEITQGNGTHYFLDIDITAPMTEGTHDLVLTLFGDNANGVSDTNGENANLITTWNLMDRVAVDNSNTVGSGGSGGSSGTGSTQVGTAAWFQAQIASIMAQLAAIKNPPAPPAPTVNPKCTLIAPYLSAPQGVSSPLGSQLQSALLLDNPYSIKALAVGSTVPMGFYGPQTAEALRAYKAAYSCY